MSRTTRQTSDVHTPDDERESREILVGQALRLMAMMYNDAYKFVLVLVRSSIEHKILAFLERDMGTGTVKSIQLHLQFYSSLPRNPPKLLY